jgi:hypothetical protein
MPLFSNPAIVVARQRGMQTERIEGEKFPVGGVCQSFDVRPEALRYDAGGFQ